MNPSGILEVFRYGSVQRFARKHLDMQVVDIRTMMRLPLPEVGLHGGCNFAATAILCNLVSGISVVLFDPPKRYYPTARKRAQRKSGRDRGIRFKAVLECHFPWAKGERKAARISVLYDYVRNPLAHELGMDPEWSSGRTAILKGPLTDPQIEELETAESKPSWVPQPVGRRGRGWYVSVAGLYWGVFWLLRNLSADPRQMTAANKRLAKRRAY